MTDLQRARRVAAALLPAEASSDAQVVRGEFHDVVLLPGRAVVKIARGRAVEHLERRAHLSAVLADQDLPFAVPVPLGPVTVFEDCSAVALSWVPGAPAPAGAGDPRRLRDLLEVLAGVDVSATSALASWLDVPHAYAGREGWSALMEQVVAALPPPVRAVAGRRVQAAAQLAAVPAGLVHGDLAGDNVRWHRDGSLAGVIDWDLASAWDPAVDAACLAWFGWPAVAAAVDEQTHQRAHLGDHLPPGVGGRGHRQRRGPRRHREASARRDPRAELRTAPLTALTQGPAASVAPVALHATGTRSVKVSSASPTASIRRAGFSSVLLTRT